MNISEELKNQILDIIFNHLDKQSTTVFLFGSYAQGTAKHYSDIDIGFIVSRNIAFSEVQEIKEELNDTVQTLRKIDLVDFGSSLDENFKRIALERIEIWYKGINSPKIINNLQGL